MKIYTLYQSFGINNNYIYCYAENDYTSYWQPTLYKAITSSLVYMKDHADVYGSNNIIYQSDQPITKDSHPELFL